MGNQKQYLSQGGFSEYLYTTVGETFYIDGYRCKMVKMEGDSDGHHAGLPSYSNTSDIYVGLGPGDTPRQMRVYKDREAYKDFDWGHEHKNKDGTVFPKGVVHVQRGPGPKRGEARYMTSEEHKQFDAIIKKFAPNAKLYPED